MNYPRSARVGGRDHHQLREPALRDRAVPGGRPAQAQADPRGRRPRPVQAGRRGRGSRAGRVATALRSRSCCSCPRCGRTRTVTDCCGPGRWPAASSGTGSWSSSAPGRDEKYAGSLRSLAAELGIATDVVFVGGVPLEETVDFYRAADVFVYPSLNETFGLPILEAMACGCPVVTSDISAMPETAGGAAVLADPDGPGVDRPRHRRGGGTGAGSAAELGLRRASQFTWGATAAATLDVYREVAERADGSDRNEDPRHRRSRLHRLPYLRPAPRARPRGRRARRADPAGTPGRAAGVPEPRGRLLPGRRPQPRPRREPAAPGRRRLPLRRLPGLPARLLAVLRRERGLDGPAVRDHRGRAARPGPGRGGVVASRRWAKGSTGARSTASSCRGCARKAPSRRVSGTSPARTAAAPLEMQATPERISNPQNAYGMSKLGQEMVAVNLGRRYGIPTVALRYSIVQGPRQSVYNAYSGACRIFCLSYLLGHSSHPLRGRRGDPRLRQHRRRRGRQRARPGG